MPRTIEISVDDQLADRLQCRVGELPGVVGMARHRGVSLQPPGDVLVLQATAEGTRRVFRVLDELRVAERGAILTAETRSLMVPHGQQRVDRESNETVWDEVAELLRQDSNMGANFLGQMSLAGGLAAVALYTGRLELLIASMVIAAAFEPLIRLPFGLIAGPTQLARNGVKSVVAGYTCMAGGALAATLIVSSLTAGAPGALHSHELVRRWSEVNATSMLTAVLASAAGTLILCGQRSVLTTGVMIALALVPSMAVTGAGLALGDWMLAAHGLVRWSSDAGLVIATSAVVLAAKHRWVHRQRALG